jgi:hypothetical protein
VEAAVLAAVEAAELGSGSVAAEAVLVAVGALGELEVLGLEEVAGE